MQKYQLEIRWGIIFTIAALAWMVIEKLAGWHGEGIANHPIYTNIFAIIAIALYVFALRAKRRQLGNQMTWKEGFIAGVIISVVVALLSPLAQLITHKIISPEYFPNAIEYAVESGNMTREAAENFFNLNSYLMQASIGALIMGLITSAIVAFFVRNRVEAK